MVRVRKVGAKLFRRLKKGVTEKGLDIFRLAHFYKFNGYSPINIFFQNYNGRY